MYYHSFNDNYSHIIKQGCYTVKSVTLRLLHKHITSQENRLAELVKSEGYCSFNLA